jgi:hypothetical protein
MFDGKKPSFTRKRRNLLKRSNLASRSHWIFNWIIGRGKENQKLIIIVLFIIEEKTKLCNVIKT